ncbi:MAG: hypothetical protein ACLFUJ_03025 [Phycisphaerae bacterium]
MAPTCSDDNLPRLCAEKFELIAERLSHIQADTSAALTHVRQISGQLTDLQRKQIDLDRRACLLEQTDSIEASWRRRLWQVFVGAALVALGALLR